MGGEFRSISNRIQQVWDCNCCKKIFTLVSKIHKDKQTLSENPALHEQQIYPKLQWIDYRRHANRRTY